MQMSLEMSQMPFIQVVAQSLVREMELLRAANSKSREEMRQLGENNMKAALAAASRNQMPRSLFSWVLSSRCIRQPPTRTNQP